MAHEIEQSADKSEAAFFTSSREGWWHVLGTLTNEAKTAEEAMKLAHLDWTVEKLPLLVDVPKVGGRFAKRVVVPDKFATVRNNPFTGELEALGVVGKVYEPVQNIENAEFLNAIVDESGAHFETAGSLQGGRRVFVSMKAPEGLLIGGEDAVDLYLVATNSHDGSSAFTVVATPIRVVCANTLRAGLANAKASFTTRHTVNASKRIDEARKALGVMWDYFQHFDTTANAMLSQKISPAQFELLLRRDLFPEPAKMTERVGRQREERISDVVNVLKTSHTIDDKMRLTNWGAYNAVTEWADWALPVRGGAEERAERIATGGSRLDELKLRAFALLS